MKHGEEGEKIGDTEEKLDLVAFQNINKNKRKSRVSCQWPCLKSKVPLVPNDLR